MPLGGRLYELRIQQGLSQHDLAERTGFHTTYISRLEKGEVIPSCHTLDVFAGAFDVPLYKLFYDREPPRARWLTPRPSLEELAERPGAQADAGLVKRVKIAFHELASLLH
jgi:transcriptional regulator with XRE-family HTH domain